MIKNVLDRHNRRTARINLKHDFFRQFPELRAKFDAVLYEVDKNDGKILSDYMYDALLAEEKKKGWDEYDCDWMADLTSWSDDDQFPEWYPDEFIDTVGGHAKLFSVFASKSKALKDGLAWFHKNTDRHSTREFMRAFVECWVRALAWDLDKVNMDKYFNLPTSLFALEYYEEKIIPACVEERENNEEEEPEGMDRYYGPDGKRWASLVQRVANRSIVASRPYMESMGLTKAKAMSGEAAMLYSIDASSNKSKYYEMLILESNAGYTLHKRWGRLGDSFRTDSKDFDDLGSAMAALAKVKRSKMRGSSKYRDAFDSRQHKTPDGKQLPKGQYPIGLSSNPGSWSNQNIQTCKPALQQLVTVIQEAINDAANEDMSGVVTDLQMANGYVSDLGTSSMANEIRKKIKAPLSRLTGMGRHKADPNKIVRELKTLSRYLSKQMSLCMTASVADRYASNERWDDELPPGFEGFGFGEDEPDLSGSSKHIRSLESKWGYSEGPHASSYLRPAGVSLIEKYGGLGNAAGRIEIFTGTRRDLGWAVELGAIASDSDARKIGMRILRSVVRRGLRSNQAELWKLPFYVAHENGLVLVSEGSKKTAGSRITSKDLREVLGNGGNFDTWEEEEAALTELAHKLNHPRINARKASELLREANEILDGHGVEVVWINNGGASDGGPELSTRYGDEVGCEYVNTGDTYSATVLYDAQKQEFMVTTWGDWTEKWEQENLLNASRYASSGWESRNAHLLQDQKPQKTQYEDLTLRKGRAFYLLTGTALHPSGKKEYIKETFEDPEEARGWVKHALGVPWREVDQSDLPHKEQLGSSESIKSWKRRNNR